MVKVLDPGGLCNPYGDDKVLDACGLFGVISSEGRALAGTMAVDAMTLMRERGNGLGAGFAGYGIYPQRRDCYAWHVMYEDRESRRDTEDFLARDFHVVEKEEIPSRPVPGVVDPPILWRYFTRLPDTGETGETGEDPEDYVVSKVMHVNRHIRGAFVFSCGRDMGVFKGVGYPEDLGRFYRLDEYAGYLWTAHSRFPTNTQGWWGGAHPFSVLDWTVVHNGEISSYGTNRAFLEMYGYFCTMHTDTEVLAYATDLLARRHGLPLSLMAAVFAPPLWTDIDRRPPGERTLYTVLRQIYGGLLMNGPFTVIIARHGEMVGLGDRIRLRPLVAGRKDDLLFLCSEEAPMRLVCPDMRDTWTPRGGELVVGRLDTRSARVS